MATHERAGEITYRNINNNPYSFEFTILTYTYAPSNANRDRLGISFGDNTVDTAFLTTRDLIGSDLYRNTYVITKTYTGPGSFVVSFEDPNRNAGIINIENSVNIPFYTETLLVIDPSGSPNNSPVLLNPPIDIGCVGNLFLHNPGAYDIDGDSLSYKLTICKGEGGNNISTYTFPDNEDHFYMDPVTGTLTWDFPTIQGEYNVAFLIEEWRNGYQIGYVTRDMQIEITVCNNTPPSISKVNDTCVVAGTYIEFPVTATDNEHVITLSAAGGPFVVNSSPAEFPKTLGNSPLTQNFSWQTNCSHVRIQDYDVSFVARDTLNNINLTTIETMKIRVIGPPPLNPESSVSGRNIILSWDPYECENINSFHIYRRKGNSNWDPGLCETGVPTSAGYTLIGSISDQFTTFMDDNEGEGLDNGHIYCYRIVAEYNNGAMSIASDEVCDQLNDNLPVISNASVTKTSVTDGEVYITWTRPDEIDDIYMNGPHRYDLYELIGESATKIYSTNDLNDTTFYHSNINTEELPHIYFVEFYGEVDNEFVKIGSSRDASTPFLTITSTDNQNILTVEAFPVPWINDSIRIFKKVNNDTDYLLLGTFEGLSYTDQNLTNGIPYCYKVETIGKFTTDYLPAKVYNFSQEACGTPTDNIPPCAPALEAETDCEDIENNLIWKFEENSCVNDVLKFYIHYAEGINTDFSIIDSTEADDPYNYEHTGLNTFLGCYAIQAVDSVGNRSELSNIVCQDYLACPVYQLPNAFSPDGDFINDLFIPLEKASSVESIDIQIFNRYGRVMFETNDPDINWNGKYQNTQNDCPEGVYFYVCTVNQRTLDGIVNRDLRGVIHLLRKE